MADIDNTPALRVSQLDAQELDLEVLNLTKSQLTNLFKYFQTGFLGRYDPEITALIKLLIWQFTLYSSDQTVGQQLLGIKYTQVRGSEAGQWISRHQKGFLAFLYIACPWLRERLAIILRLLHLSSREQQIEACLKWTETGLKMVSLVNFLLFLRQGVYLSVVERLLGVQAQFPQRQSMRQVSFDFMTRELLWHGFSEFLSFLLPLINIQRVKNTVFRWIAPRTHTSENLEQRCQADLMSCVVCGEWPVRPHHINCRHIFCYYCIASNLKADPEYTCPVCAIKSASITSPQPVRTTIGPN